MSDVIELDDLTSGLTTDAELEPVDGVRALRVTWIAWDSDFRTTELRNGEERPETVSSEFFFATKGPKHVYPSSIVFGSSFRSSGPQGKCCESRLPVS